MFNWEIYIDVSAPCSICLAPPACSICLAPPCSICLAPPCSISLAPPALPTSTESQTCFPCRQVEAPLEPLWSPFWNPFGFPSLRRPKFLICFWEKTWKQTWAYQHHHMLCCGAVLLSYHAGKWDESKNLKRMIKRVEKRLPAWLSD